MAKQKLKEQNLDGFTVMYGRYVNYVSNLNASQRKTKLITAIFIMLLLIAVSTALTFIPIFEEGTFSGSGWGIWVQTAIAFPGGIIFFAILVGLQKTTRIKNWKLSNFKDKYSHRQRIKSVSISLVILATVLIFSGGLIPYAVGGTLMTGVLFTAYNLLRRTPAEIKLAEQGIIDPRDINADGSVSKSVIKDAEYSANNLNQE